MSDTEAPDIPVRLPPTAYVLAVVLGIVGATGATVFLWLMHELQHGFIEGLPQAFGWESAPAWWIVGGLLISVAIILIAQRMPGHTGKGPLTGFHFDNPPKVAPSILLAALATLTFGAALGPEGPLIVVGTTLGGLLMRKAPANVVTLAMFLTGIAAIGAIFGNPFITAFLLLEFAAMGAAPKVILLPAFVALGSGYITQVGWGSWTGLGTMSLSVPGLPSYDHINPGDLLAGIAVAIVAALLTAVAREMGERVQTRSERSPAIMLLIAALVTAGVAIAVVEIFDVNYDQILFSGQSGMPGIIAETSVAAVIAIVIGKLLVYGLALGAGFRGGPIFPATFIGVGFGVLAALLFTDLSVSAMAAVGIASAATVMTRLPFTSGLIAMLLIGSAGAAIAPFAIIGAIGGFAAAKILDAYDAKRTGVPATPIG